MVANDPPTFNVIPVPEDVIAVPRPMVVELVYDVIKRLVVIALDPDIKTIFPIIELGKLAVADVIIFVPLETPSVTLINDAVCKL